MSAASQVRDYEEEVASVVESVRRDMSALRATLPDQSAGTKAASDDAKLSLNRSEMLTGISEGIVRLRSTISQLEVASVEIGGAVQVELVSRIKGYRGTLTALERERDALRRQAADADRDDLTKNVNAAASSSRGEKNATSNDDAQIRRALSANTAKIRDGGKLLGEAERTLAVIHDTADATLEELERQKRTTQDISGTVAEMDAELTQVQRIMRKMQRELLKNKLTLAAVIVILVICIIGVLYYKFGSTSTSTPASSAAVGSGSGSGGGSPAPTFFTIPPLPPN